MLALAVGALTSPLHAQECADGVVQQLIIDRESGPTYWERRDTGVVQVGWPYRLRSTVFANYSFTNRRAIIDLPAETWLPEVPLRGRTGALAALDRRL